MTAWRGWKRNRMKNNRPHLFVACALAVVLLSGLHRGLENTLTDLRFGWTQRDASGGIVVVGIDPDSIDRIGVWPWPRSVHARMIEQLDRAGAGDIAFDIDFSSPSDATSDAAFAAALRQAGGSVVLPTFQQAPRVVNDRRSPAHINKPLPQFAADSWPAVVNVAIEPDGRVRRYPFGDRINGTFVPSMAAMLAGRQNTVRPPFLIDFGIRASSVPTVSYVDVLDGKPEALRKIKGRKVIVGGTALELGDRFSVPNGAVVAGPLLQALAAESILQNRDLAVSSGWLAAVGLVLLAIIMTLAWRLSAGRRVLVLLACSGLVEAAAVALQGRFPVVLDTSLLHSAVVGYLAAVALDEIDFRGLLNRIAERRFKRITMSLGDGLVCADPSFAITMWNPGAQTIFGYRAEEVIGRPFDLLCATPGDGKTTAFSIRDLTQEMLAAPGGQLLELQGRRNTGEIFPLEACLSGWQGADGFHYGAVLRDISARKREADRIRYMAEYDTITGIRNRNTLEARLIALMDHRARPLVLLMISVNKFEQTCAMLGHGFGDMLLRAVAERLVDTLAGAIVARVDGDEFALVAEGDGGTAVAICRSCMRAFDRPLQVGAREHRVAVTIGVATYPDDATTCDELLGNGHLALHRAKASGGVNPVFYHRRFREELEARLSTEADLLRALENDEFELYYQPQVSLADHRVIGAEALIRWRHPQRGLVPPMQFMPIVNASPISNRVAGWVMETACRRARSWEQMGCGLRMGVNLSPSQMQSGDLFEEVRRVLASTGLTPGLLELEVTEDILIEDADSVRAMFRRIQQLGVAVVFDDFGTGFASLSYLKHFPLDGLKIDRSFVRDLAANAADAAIVESTIALGRKLGLSVIAEGVEDGVTADILTAMGCTEAQGYHFGRPVPAAEFEQSYLASPARGASSVPEALAS
jgi:diguanylate cyclase (GGDEF)-like protein/PAS domain S-box-containing protein